jgi:hypothetical protein
MLKMSNKFFPSKLNLTKLLARGFAEKRSNRNTCVVDNPYTLQVILIKKTEIYRNGLRR